MPKPDGSSNLIFPATNPDGGPAYNVDDPSRFAFHVLRAMQDLRGSTPLRILDFGGGDGPLFIEIAKHLRSQGKVGADHD